MKNLANKNIVITGAMGLIGKKISEVLAINKVNVIMLDIKNKQDIIKIKNYHYIKRYLNYLKCDVSNEKSLKKVSKIIFKRYKKIDVLINAAAITDAVERKDKDKVKNSMFENFTTKDWNRSILGNLNSMFLCSQIFGKEMIKFKNGSIINFSSTYGIVGPDQSIYTNKYKQNLFYKNPAYPTAKGAVISFTKYLAAYWGHKGIRVNCISPGGIQNNQSNLFIKKYSSKTLLGRMANVEDVIGVIKLLCSDESNYITGSNLVVDGGWTSI